jgi:hypothetical protein
MEKAGTARMIVTACHHILRHSFRICEENASLMLHPRSKRQLRRRRTKQSR